MVCGPRLTRHPVRCPKVGSVAQTNVPSMSLRSRLLKSLAVLAILLVLDHLQELLSLATFYRGLYKVFPFYVPEGGKSILQIVLAVIALQLLTRESARAAMAELGFFAPLVRGLTFGFGAALVMFAGFAATLPLKIPSDWAVLLYLAGLSPLAEETVYRAFGVGTLAGRCGAPRWLALLLPAIVFGLGHIQEGASWSERLGLFMLTASGGILFGWFYLRWWRNVWMPFSIHAGMNLSWELFDVSRNAIGGWWPFVLQTGTLVVGILATVKFAPRRAAGVAVETGT